ncbi:MAG: RBBP9/YdeN family alpha/beta hydrolase [Candidatus Saccharimonadales bacterium]
MKTAIILHGTLGSPDGNWFQWLKKELEAKGLTVWLPQLPQAEKPSLRKWQLFIKDQCPFPINEGTLIVGHSSGAILALVLAENNMEKIGAIVDVSVFHNNSLQWQPNDNLFDVQFDWTAIRNGVNKLLFIHSDNDPYVPLNQAQYVATKTGAEMIVITGEGHFNLERSDEYKQFPKLLEILEERKLV